MRSLLTAIALLAVLSDSEAATYECTSVDNKATVASHDPVSVTSNRNRKTCHFSVAGAATGLRSANVKSILMQLQRGESVLRGERGAYDLAALLMSADNSSESNQSKWVENQVRGHMIRLEQCVQAFRLGQHATFRDSSTGLSCVVLSPSRTPQPADAVRDYGAQLAGAIVTTDQEILELAIRTDNTVVRQVFFPASWFGR